ncbi:unnamed protein product [Linum trigynum]|uniref:Uncharacterized protein n=1 Tax=Linum trigynum TaxID=586398 RepID=A0AAV2FV50_9ROSI
MGYGHLGHNKTTEQLKMLMLLVTTVMALVISCITRSVVAGILIYTGGMGLTIFILDRQLDLEEEPLLEEEEELVLIDWKGLKLEDPQMQIMVVTPPVMALVMFCLTGSLLMMILIFAYTVVIISIGLIPYWPCFNRHHLPLAEKHPPLVVAC